MRALLGTGVSGQRDLLSQFKEGSKGAVFWLLCYFAVVSVVKSTFKLHRQWHDRKIPFVDGEAEQSPKSLICAEIAPDHIAVAFVAFNLCSETERGGIRPFADVLAHIFTSLNYNIPR